MRMVDMETPIGLTSNLLRTTNEFLSTLESLKEKAELAAAHDNTRA